MCIRDRYVQSVSGSASAADELAKLADLKERGLLSDAEFELSLIHI